MALAKLELTPFDKRGNRLMRKRIKVQFNPETVSISKTVGWSDLRGEDGDTSDPNRKLNAPPLDFDGGHRRTLTLSLFFDATEPVNGKRVSDVRKLTNPVAALARIERTLGHPPIVRIAWGHAPHGSDFPFIGVLTSLTQTFTLFSESGKPLRADLSTTFVEFLIPELDQRLTDPELTTRPVRRGDSLASIAADVYQDPREWRRIADANQLDDPRRLDVGRTLSIPD